MALLLLQRPFGFVAQLGVIALFGMIIRNSVILIDQIKQDIVAGAAPGMRLSNRLCDAVAIMGGLIIATALILLFLPALYAAWFRVKKPACPS